jgi:hypothetical protein
VEKQYYIFWVCVRARARVCVCVCSLNHPACKTNALHFICHLWSVWFYHIFAYYLTNSVIFGKNCSIQNVFWFSLQVSSEHFSF